MSAAHAGLSRSAKLHRDRVWQILRVHHAPALWRPEWIDAALNLAPPVASFANICVRVAQRNRSYPALTSSDLIQPTGEPMREWLRQEARRRVWQRDLQEEARSILVESTMRAIQTYVPSRQNSNGRWHSQGFGAYLHLRSSNLYRRTRRTMDACGANHLDSLLNLEALSPPLALVSTVQRDYDLIRLLIKALRKSLDSPLKWDCFHALTYLGRSLRNVAKEHDVPKSNLSRQVAEPIVSTLQSVLHPLVEPLAQSASGNLGLVAQAFGALLSHDEFAVLVPRPENSETRPRGEKER